MRACQFTESAYDPSKLEAHYLTILQSHRTGQPQYYEIQVDGLTITPKTADAERFWDFSQHVTVHSREITVLLYFSEKSKATDKYFYHLKSEPASRTEAPAALNGFPPTPVLDAQALREQWEKEQYLAELETENESLKEEIEELNQTIVDIEAEKEKLENEWYIKLAGGIDRVGSTLEGTPIQGFISSFLGTKKNDNLSGTASPEGKSSFKRKSAVHTEPQDVESEEVNAEPLTESDQKYLATLYEIKLRVGEANLNQVFELIDMVTAQPRVLPFAFKQVSNYLRQRPNTNPASEQNPEKKDPLSEVPHF